MADDELTRLFDTARTHARECAKLYQESVLAMVNGAIVQCEDAGLEAMPLKVARILADAIANMPLPASK